MSTDFASILATINELPTHERDYVRAMVEHVYDDDPTLDDVMFLRTEFRQLLVPNTARAVERARSLLIEADEGPVSVDRLARKAAMALLGAVVEGDY